MKFLKSKIIIAVVPLLLPLLSLAQTNGTRATSTTSASPTGGARATGGGGGTNLTYELKNPIAFNSLQDFIVALLNVFIIIATPIVIIFIILAGFKYVTARGNPSDIQEATRALTYAIIGGVLIIGAVAIAEIIKDLVTSFS